MIIECDCLSHMKQFFHDLNALQLRIDRHFKITFLSTLTNIIITRWVWGGYGVLNPLGVNHLGREPPWGVTALGGRMPPTGIRAGTAGAR